MYTSFEVFCTRLEDTRAKHPDGVDIKTELTRFSTDIISNCAFGLNSNTMKDENEELLKHGRSFFDYQWNIYKNSMVLALPRHVLQKINFKIFSKESTRFVTDMYNDLKSYRNENQIQRDDLANTVIKMTEKREEYKDYSGKNVMEPLNENEYVAQMWVFFCASFETSSSMQTFTLYELSRNPDCQNKLREEINTILARYDNEISYDAVMEMTYLEAVIDGKLKLFSLKLNCIKMTS